ncbi:MAG TPA: hypothetical protein VIY29_15895 [Ktedonobacteraceae bacterium]
MRLVRQTFTPWPQTLVAKGLRRERRARREHRSIRHGQALRARHTGSVCVQCSSTSPINYIDELVPRGMFAALRSSSTWPSGALPSSARRTRAVSRVAWDNPQRPASGQTQGRPGWSHP